MTPKTTDNPHKYHVVLSDGTERDVPGRDVHTHDGALIIDNAAGEAAVLYAPGQWMLCELERRDDRG